MFSEFIDRLLKFDISLYLKLKDKNIVVRVGSTKKGFWQLKGK